MSLAFRDQAGRDHMTKTDGQEDSWNKMEDYSYLTPRRRWILPTRSVRAPFH
jgi:hypothetical protein